MRDQILEQGPIVRRGLLLAITAAVPLFFLPFTNEPFTIPKFALLAMLLSLVAGLRAVEIIQGATWRGLERLLIPTVVFIVPLFVSWALTDFRHWSLFGWYPRFLGLVPYVLVVLYGALVADGFVGRAHLLAWAYALGGTTAGFYGLLQLVGADPFAWSTAGGGISPVISTLGNSNFAGTYLAMALPFLVFLWISEPRYRKHLSWMTALVAVVCLATLSRAATVAAVAGLLVIFEWVLQPRWGWARRLGLLGAGVAASGLLAAVIYRMMEPGVGSIAYRSNWWRAAFEMGATSPIVGHGPATFALEGIRWRPLHDAITFGYGFADDPHSVILSLFTAAGALGVLGFLFLLFWVLRQGVSTNKLLSGAFLASSLVYFVNSTATIDELALRVALWGTIGGLVASNLSDRDEKPTGKRSPSRGRALAQAKKRRRSRPLTAMPGVVAVSVLTLAAFAWSGGVFLADARVQAGEALFQQDRTQEARTKFRKAIGFRDEYAYRHLYGLYLGQEAVADPSQGPELIEEMDQAFAFVHTVPYVPAIVDYAKRLYEWGQTDPDAYGRALELYERASSLDPLNPVLVADKSDVLIALERFDQAELELNEFLQRTDRSAEIHGALSLVYFHTGDLERAEEEAATALQLYSVESRAIMTLELLEKRD